MTEPNGHGDGLEYAAQAERQRNLFFLHGALLAHGAVPSTGCWLAIDDDATPPVPGCLVLVNSRLTGAALAAAAPCIVATLRDCADELEAATALPHGCGVPPEWVEGEQR